MAPARVIQGQLTRLSRTTHGIAYDTTNDEIIAPNPLAAAVVIFRGGATGEEAPVRTLQGARTGLSRPETVAVDEKNNELIVGDPGDRRVLVYRRTADGDAAPIRTIQGPKTKLLQVVGVAVDPVRDLLVVSTYSRLPGGVTGILIFGRTDQGDVAPKRVITGPKTGITRLRQIGLDPETGKIYVAAINNEYLPPYDVDKPRAGLDANAELPSPWNTGTEGFIGVWDDVEDDGDVPPRSMIKGRSTGIVHPAGVTFNAKDGEVIAPDAVWNGLFTLLKSVLFKGRPEHSAGSGRLSTGRGRRSHASRPHREDAWRDARREPRVPPRAISRRRRSRGASRSQAVHDAVDVSARRLGSVDPAAPTELRTASARSKCLRGAGAPGVGQSPGRRALARRSRVRDGQSVSRASRGARLHLAGARPRSAALSVQHADQQGRAPRSRRAESLADGSDRLGQLRAVHRDHHPDAVSVGHPHEVRSGGDRPRAGRRARRVGSGCRPHPDGGVRARDRVPRADRSRQSRVGLGHSRIAREREGAERAAASRRAGQHPDAAEHEARHRAGPQPRSGRAGRRR